jgi:Aldehyde dehydrogenase family
MDAPNGHFRLFVQVSVSLRFGWWCSSSSLMLRRQTGLRAPRSSGPSSPSRPSLMPMMSWRWPRTPWGLVGYVVTQDLDRALNVSEEREVGMVGLNAGIVSDPATPFGGVDIWAGPGRRSPRHRRVPRIQVDQHADSTVSLPSVRCTTDAMPTGVNRALVTRSVSRR